MSSALGLNYSFSVVIPITVTITVQNSRFLKKWRENTSPAKSSEISKSGEGNLAKLPIG